MQIYGNTPEMYLYYQLQEKYPDVDIEIPERDKRLHETTIDTTAFEIVFYPTIVEMALGKLGPRWVNKIGTCPMGLKDPLEIVQYRNAMDELGKSPLPVNVRELAKGIKYVEVCLGLIKKYDHLKRMDDMYCDVIKRWRNNEYSFANSLTKNYVEERLQRLVTRSFADIDKIMIISMFKND